MPSSLTPRSLQIADQLRAGDVDVGKSLRVAVAIRQQPAGLDPRFAAPAASSRAFRRNSRVSMVTPPWPGVG